MLVRLDATTRRPPSLVRQNRAAGRRIDQLVWILSILTALFVVWVLWRYGIAPAKILRAPSWLRDLLGLLTAAALLTLSMLWGLVLWQRHQLNQSPTHTQAMSLDELYGLTPRQFEHYVAGLFRQRGYQVEVRGRSGDLGVDLALRRADGRLAIVQCKRYRHTIGPEIVRELFGTMVHERAYHGFLVTTAGISDSARAWAADKPITLIDGQTLVTLDAAVEG